MPGGCDYLEARLIASLFGPLKNGHVVRRYLEVEHSLATSEAKRKGALAAQVYARLERSVEVLYMDGAAPGGLAVVGDHDSTTLIVAGAAPFDGQPFNDYGLHGANLGVQQAQG